MTHLMPVISRLAAIVVVLPLSISLIACSVAATSPTPYAGGAAGERPAATLAAGATPASGTASAGASPRLALQWFGQSTFLVTTSLGTRVLIDPASASTGYSVQPIQDVDVVVISHEHADHNNVGLALGNPTVVRGLKDGDWARVEQTVRDVRLFSVATYHDDQRGANRGKNAVFVLEADGLRLVHLGDLGHLLSQEQVAAIGRPDLLMVPVGGFYTIDAAAATQVVGQLSPRIVVPMHYKTPKLSPQLPLAPVDQFLEGKKVETIPGNRVELSKEMLPDATTVYLLGYE